MKKKVILTLEVESDDMTVLSDDFIRNDLEREINCCSNTYEITDFWALNEWTKEEIEAIERVADAYSQI